MFVAHDLPLRELEIPLERKPDLGPLANYVPPEVRHHHSEEEQPTDSIDRQPPRCYDPFYWQ
ncbi:hypothetical protein KC906_00325 [Candidatus Kaiserbacteria bacterium]|nr:hypothetical protein [Candidatus Kaiserbacteria bacterium]